MKHGLVNPTCKKTTFISTLSAISQIGYSELGDGIAVVFTNSASVGMAFTSTIYTKINVLHNA
jgi:hypothetical protein